MVHLEGGWPELSVANGVELLPLSVRNQTRQKRFQLPIPVFSLLNYKIKILLESIYSAILEQDKKKSPLESSKKKKKKNQHMPKFGGLHILLKRQMK